MASPTQSEPKISLKLMVHREKKKVIFAEADGHFVDALFSFMTLPLGTTVRLLAKQPDEKQKPLMSLQNIYKSLMDLSDDFFSAEECKFVLLNPRISSFGLCRKLKLKVDDTEPIKYYVCSTNYCSRSKYFITSNDALCSCGYPKDRELSTNDLIAGVDDNVFVSKLVSFIVTDDLRVMPNASSFVIQLFCEHGITGVSHIEEMTLDIGLEQVSILLNMALKEIPLGTVIGKLFSGTSSLECVDNLYASICNMNVGEGIKSQDLKDMLLQPKALRYVCTDEIFPLIDDTTFSSGNVSYTYIHLKESYLKSPAKFMLTDDLVITPLSSTSTVAVLSRLKISLNDVETHKADIGIEEGLKILHASLNSVSTLTDSLLQKVVETKK